MENIKISVKESILTIKIDLSQKGRSSKTGKMQLLASSGGWNIIEQNFTDKVVKMNLQLGYKRE